MSGGYSLVVVHELPAVVVSTVVEHRLSSCGALTQFVAPGLSCSVACGIFLTMDQTHVPCIARQILNPWTTREVPVYTNI